MKRPQFSLWWLLGLTALVAVGCTALMNASAAWAMSLHSALLALLLVAVLRAIYRHGAVRAFWIGFALFGWVYLILVYWVHYNSQFTDGFNDPRGSELATTWLLQWGYDTLLPLVRQPPAATALLGPSFGGGFGGGLAAGSGGALPQASGGTIAGAFGGGAAPVPYYPDLQTFIRVGQPLCALVLAILGGWTARWLYRPNSGSELGR
jgi:hypothetical protein